MHIIFKLIIIINKKIPFPVSSKKIKNCLLAREHINGSYKIITIILYFQLNIILFNLYILNN